MKKLKIKPKPSCKMTIYFTNQTVRSYYIYSSNSVFGSVKKGLHYISGAESLMSQPTIWKFNHTKGVSIIKTSQVIDISLEDIVENPLSTNEHYDNPLN